MGYDRTRSHYDFIQQDAYRQRYPDGGLPVSIRSRLISERQRLARIAIPGASGESNLSVLEHLAWVLRSIAYEWPDPRQRGRSRYRPP